MLYIGLLLVQRNITTYTHVVPDMTYNVFGGTLNLTQLPRGFTRFYNIH